MNNARGGRERSYVNGGGAAQQSSHIFVPGETMDLSVFGNQPPDPPVGSRETTWDQTPFKTHSPMVMEYKHEQIGKVELVPIRMPVYIFWWGKGPNDFWVWVMKCRNRAKLANSYNQPCPPPRMAPRPYCPPRIPYCAPQQPRIMQVPYCRPTPCRQVLMCPPVQRQWCPPGYVR